MEPGKRAESEGEDDKIDEKLLRQRRSSVCDEGLDPARAQSTPVLVYSKTQEQHEQLTKGIKNIVLFQSLDSHQINALVDAMFSMPIKAGDRVIKQGHDGDYFYIVEKGTFEASEIHSDGKSTPLATYGPGGYFGELALMYNVPRAATVRALTDGSLWVLDRETFKQIVLKGAHIRRQQFEKVVHAVPVLKHLDENEKMRLCDGLSVKQFEDGDTIFEKDDEPDGIYFVFNDKVTIKVQDTPNNVHIFSLKLGDYFGEFSVLKKTKRAVTVISVNKTSFAFLQTDNTERLLAPCLKEMMRKFDKPGTKFGIQIVDYAPLV